MNLRRLLTRLGSPRLAAGLMVASIVMLLLAVVIPQSAYLGQTFDEFANEYPTVAGVLVNLGLDRLFGSWIIVTFSVLLAVNVVSCTVVRFLVRQGGVRPVRRVRAMSAWSGEPVTAIDRAQETLMSAGWRTVRTSERELVAERGWHGFWGSVVLHASLLVIMAGGVASGLTIFKGEMVIIDGQMVKDEAPAYLRVDDEPRYGSAFTGASLALDETTVAYEDGILVKAVAKMRGIDPSGRVITKEVSVNHPLDVAGKSYLLMDSGLAAEIILAQEGSPAQNRVISLKEETEYGWFDRIEIPRAGAAPVVVGMTAAPVPLTLDESLPPEELDIKDPRLFVRVEREAEDPLEATLAPGESVEVSPGLTLSFVDARLWNHYIVRGDQGRWVSYLGFWLAVVGAAWRFAVPHRVISVWSRPGEGDIAIGYRARPWPGFEVSRDEALLDSLAPVEQAETL